MTRFWGMYTAYVKQEQGRFENRPCKDRDTGGSS